MKFLQLTKGMRLVTGSLNDSFITFTWLIGFGIWLMKLKGIYIIVAGVGLVLVAILHNIAINPSIYQHIYYVIIPLLCIIATDYLNYIELPLFIQYLVDFISEIYPLIIGPLSTILLFVVIVGSKEPLFIIEIIALLGSISKKIISSNFFF
jgi:hypothetical protein